MSIGAVSRRIAAPVVAAVLMAGGAAALFLGGSATAQPNVPDSVVPVGVYEPGTPFSSGQVTEVSLPSGTFPDSDAGQHVQILECSDPEGLPANDPTSVEDCDGNTVQPSTVLINSSGGISYTGYPLYALPDANLGEPSDSTPVCNTTNWCVLFVGLNQESFTSGTYVFSQPFLVAPNPSDNGAHPGDGSSVGATLGESFSQTVYSGESGLSGGTVKVHGKLPAGVTAAIAGDNAVVSGTPTAGGYFSAELEFTFGSGSNRTTATVPYVLGVGSAPTIKSHDDATAKPDEPFSFSIVTAGYPIASSITESGALPLGVGFVNTGLGVAVLSGIPAASAAGTYPLTITASNGVGTPATQSFTLTVS